MAGTEQLNQQDSREKYVRGWNATMIDIWQERIYALRVYNTGMLYRSVMELPVTADGRFTSFSLSQLFLEYGIWQDLGTGREVPFGNHGDIGRAKVRERRRWFSTKYYSSVMNLKDFMAESLGREFIGMFAANLDSDNLRYASKHYQRMGYTKTY